MSSISLQSRSFVLSRFISISPNLIWPLDLRRVPLPGKIAYKEIMDVTIKNKGTVSAEHGIGRIKKEYLRMMYKSEAIAQKQTIKKILDPKRTLNSENLF
jgi:FAD/FMN-containing dehydrogenase